MTPRELLEDRGLLRQKGKGSETYYQPTPKLLETWRGPGDQPGLDPVPGPNLQSVNPSSGSVNLTPQSVNPPAQSGNQVPRYAALPGLPAELEQAVTLLKARVSQPEMEELVWRLRLWKALATEELATLLNRNRNYVQDRLVTSMVRAGRLEMTIPDQPNHPDQRYRAIT